MVFGCIIPSNIIYSILTTLLLCHCLPISSMYWTVNIASRDFCGMTYLLIILTEFLCSIHWSLWNFMCQKFCGRLVKCQIIILLMWQLWRFLVSEKALLYWQGWVISQVSHSSRYSVCRKQLFLNFTNVSFNWPSCVTVILQLRHLHLL